ncbi:MAG: hypothetical protein R3F37_22225 [Candidatus Competibacteraceae bacterium]
MANLITLGRLLLLFILVGLLYRDTVFAQISAFFLLIIIFVMDGLWTVGWRANALNPRCSERFSILLPR